MLLLIIVVHLAICVLTSDSSTGWTGLIAKVIHDTGINCRLPQTPRTPTAAAAHYSDSYFDEIFIRSNKPRIRRSSTSRSIGNRSSFNNSENGETYDETAIDSTTNGEERNRRRSEANQHIANYIQDRLRMGDEFEHQLT